MKFIANICCFILIILFYSCRKDKIIEDSPPSSLYNKWQLSKTNWKEYDDSGNLVLDSTSIAELPYNYFTFKSNDTFQVEQYSHNDSTYKITENRFKTLKDSIFLFFDAPDTTLTWPMRYQLFFKELTMQSTGKSEYIYYPDSIVVRKAVTTMYFKIAN